MDRITAIAVLLFFGLSCTDILYRGVDNNDDADRPDQDITKDDSNAADEDIANADGDNSDKVEDPLQISNSDLIDDAICQNFDIDVVKTTSAVLKDLENAQETLRNNKLPSILADKIDETELADDLLSTRKKIDKYNDLVDRYFKEGILKMDTLTILTHRELADTEHVLLISTTENGSFDDMEIFANLNAFAETLDGQSVGLPIVKKTRLSDLKTTTKPLAFTVVIDNSGSMFACDLNETGKAVGSLYESLPAIYDSEIVKFSENTYVTAPFSSSRTEIIEDLGNHLNERSTTALYDGMDLALKELKSAENADRLFSIVLTITDGLENASEMKRSELVEESLAYHIPLFIVGLGMTDIPALYELAQESSGFFVYTPSSKQLTKLLENVALLFKGAIYLNIGFPPDFDRSTIAGIRIKSQRNNKVLSSVTEVTY